MVADRDGQPLAAAGVSLRTDGDGDEWSSGTRMQTASARDGSFSFDMVPAGTYRLRVERNGYAETEERELRVPSRGSPPPVTVRLVTGVDVVGRVELPTGTEPPRWMFVEFRRADDGGGRKGARVGRRERRLPGDRSAPRAYEVRVRGRDLRLEREQVEVPSQGLEGFVLRTRREVPDAEETMEGGVIERARPARRLSALRALIRSAPGV